MRIYKMAKARFCFTALVVSGMLPLLFVLGVLQQHTDKQELTNVILKWTGIKSHDQSHTGQLVDNNKNWMMCPGTEGSQCVYAIAELNETTFLLFTTGFRHLTNISFTNCMINDRLLPVLRIGPDMFQCHKSEDQFEESALVSIELAGGVTVPSVTLWKDRRPLVLKEGAEKIPVCIMTMMKDEEDKVDDWVQYHLRQRIGLIVVYHNNSTDRTLAQLNRFKSHVMVIEWPWRKSKNEAIIHSISYMRRACVWMFHIDVDEYIYPTAHQAAHTVRQLLMGDYQPYLNYSKWKNHPDVQQLCLETKVMGPSGHIRCPNVPVAEAYVEFDRWWYPHAGKCAVNPSYATPASAVHRFSVPGITRLFRRDAMHLVHYKHQCWDYYLTKFSKGRSAGPTKDWDMSSVHKNRPGRRWTHISGVTDTSFRDYKRKVDGWPLPKDNIWNRIETVP